MRIESVSKQTATLVLSADTAARLLQDLRERADLMEDVGEELAEALSEAGVQPAAPPPPRYEY